MAVITNYSFQSCDERHTKINAVKYVPENSEVTAVLQLVHGMGEYIDRYSEFAAHLTEKGFAVFGHDHIGHGYSVEKAEDRGIMHCKYPDDVLIEDIYSNYKIIKEQYKDKPCFILGHSMGSYLLRKYLCVKAEDISSLNGAIIMGTGSENDIALVAGNAICSLLSAIKGRDARSGILPLLMFNSYYKQYDLTGKHPENSWLSKNVENVKAFTDPSDERNICPFSINGYKILLRSTLYDNRMKNLKLMNKNIPVLFVSGDKDPVGAFGKGVRRSYDMFKEAGVRDLSIKLYEGDRHEILNELDRAAVYEDLYEWMKERI